MSVRLKLRAVSVWRLKNLRATIILSSWFRTPSWSFLAVEFTTNFTSDLVLWPALLKKVTQSPPSCRISDVLSENTK